MMVKRVSCFKPKPNYQSLVFQPTEQQIGCCGKCRRVGCPVFKSQLRQLYTRNGSKLLKLPKPWFLICKMGTVIPLHRTVGKIKGMSVNELLRIWNSLLWMSLTLSRLAPVFLLHRGIPGKSSGVLEDERSEAASPRGTLWGMWRSSTGYWRNENRRKKNKINHAF